MHLPVIAIAALTTLALSAPARAAVTIYECRFATGAARDGNWVPKALSLRYDDRSGQVTVNDPLIRHFMKKPVRGRLVDKTAVRTTFAWKLETRGLPGSDGNVGFDYSFSHFRNGLPATLRASPRGYDNDFTGEGKCTLRRG